MKCRRCNTLLVDAKEGWNKCPKCHLGVFIPKGGKVKKGKGEKEEAPKEEKEE